jgi:hypothetical protein
VARVFISHSSTDVALASEVHQWLAQDGHEVFLDRDPQDGIEIGEEWQQRLHERLALGRRDGMHLDPGLYQLDMVYG